MTPLAYVAVGVAAWIIIGIALLAVREDEFAQLLGEMALALVVGPVLLFRGAFRCAPRAVPLSPAALKRFASIIDQNA